jgi:hypothetical protein
MPYLGSNGDNSSGYGWTGVDTTWRSARFPLDEIRDGQPAGNSSVRFRVVFSSDQQNPDGTTYDGFAFDNLFIGERTHNVLFEHFDNLTAGNMITSTNTLADRYTLDMIPLQYHNDYPEPDTIYNNNPFPVETRGTIYNLNQSPKSFMDGMKEYNYSGSLIEDYQIINRSLVTPLFDVQITYTLLSASSVDVNVTVTANMDFAQPIVINVMPIETMIDDPNINQPLGIDSLNNIVKDMLAIWRVSDQYSMDCGNFSIFLGELGFR